MRWLRSDMAGSASRLPKRRIYHKTRPHLVFVSSGNSLGRSAGEFDEDGRGSSPSMKSSVAGRGARSISAPHTTASTLIPTIVHSQGDVGSKKAGMEPGFS